MLKRHHYSHDPFHSVDNLFIAVEAFPMSMLVFLSVDEILLSRYVKWFTNFKGMQFSMKMAPSLKLRNSALS